MQNVGILQKIDEAAISPPYIININSFLLHHLATVALLLLDEKRYEDNFSCRMIPD